MAEGYYSDEASRPSRRMGWLATSGTPTRHADAPSRNLADFPAEIHRLVLDNLKPAQGMIPSYEPGSRASRSANADLHALHALCLVSRKMVSVVREYLYGTIVVFDSYNLMKLRETLDCNPYLGSLVKSLSVYKYIDSSDIEHQRLLGDGYDPGAVTLSQFSEALVAVLGKTPELVMLSLKFDKPPFGDPTPFKWLKEYLRTDMSRARQASFPREFLPKLDTLGIILPPRGENTYLRLQEYRIFEGLLNCPALSHIVVRRTRRDRFPGEENYKTLFSKLVIHAAFVPGPLSQRSGLPHMVLHRYAAADTHSLLGQRKEALRGTISSIDSKVACDMPWDDIWTIGSLFPALSSLKLSHLVHTESRRWAQSASSDRFQMQGLDDLSIDIDSLEKWYPSEWFLDSIKARFCLAPNLKSLRIPLRLFRKHTEVPDLMCHPVEVLPGTLEKLVLVADLRVYPEEDWDNGADFVVEDEYGQEVPYPIRSPLSYSWTVWFLQSLQRSTERYFPGLEMVTLEYKTNLIKDPDANEMLVTDPDADQISVHDSDTDESSDDPDADEISLEHSHADEVSLEGFDADEDPVYDHVDEINNILRNSEGNFLSQLDPLEQGFEGEGIDFILTRL